MNDDKVAEDAKAGEEEDAAIKVEVEAKSDELAHEVPEDPVFSTGVVVNQEGKAGEIQQVGAGQVQHDDGAASPGPHFEDVCGDGYHISRKTHQEYDAINNREVVRLEGDIFIGAIFKSSCIIRKIRGICKII